MAGGDRDRDRCTAVIGGFDAATDYFTNLSENLSANGNSIDHFKLKPKDEFE
jgi:hypothetical protein